MDSSSCCGTGHWGPAVRDCHRLPIVPVFVSSPCLAGHSVSFVLVPYGVLCASDVTLFENCSPNGQHLWWIAVKSILNGVKCVRQ